MNENKKIVQSGLYSETGKVILLKDLSNLAAAAKQGMSRNSVDGVVDTLMDKYGECEYPCCYACFDSQ